MPLLSGTANLLLVELSQPRIIQAGNLFKRPISNAGSAVQEKRCSPFQRLEHHLVQGAEVVGKWWRGFPKGRGNSFWGYLAPQVVYSHAEPLPTLCVDTQKQPSCAQRVQTQASPAVFLFSLPTGSRKKGLKQRLVPLQLVPCGFSFQRYMQKSL